MPLLVCASLHLILCLSILLDLSHPTLTFQAMDDIDYVVANTIAQCSVFVAGIWGWLLYAELDAKTWGVVAFFLSSSLLVGGASIVAYYGTSK